MRIYWKSAYIIFISAFSLLFCLYLLFGDLTKSVVLDLEDPHSRVNLGHLGIPADAKNKKIILSWTGFLGILLDDKYFRPCPELRKICEITTDRKRFKEADALVFHPPDMNWKEVPPGRTPDQRYAFLIHESPTSMATPNMDQIPNFFNWTMTYRMDSDIPFPYWYLTQNATNRFEIDYDQILNKSSSIVWFVSKCSTASKRELYIRELQKYIQIDIYGQCGDKKCPKAVDEYGYAAVSDCERELIDKKYKFYIAFENSVCRDYITEKFYARWRFNSVPIVLSRRIVENALPPNSFIAADDFQAPAQLAEYLNMLMKNDTEYLKYFEWKAVGYSETNRHPNTGIQWGYCGMCEKLWTLEKEGANESKSYNSISAWWGADAACDNNLITRLIKKT